MKINLWGIALLAVATSFAASCTDTRYKQALDEREAEIKALREERTAVKNQNRDLSTQNKTLDAQLMEANAKLLEEPKHEKGQDFPDLDKAGIGYGMRDGNLVISIPSEITFAPGKADLSSGGKKALGAVASTLKGKYKDDEYWIEGHTDSDPITKAKFTSNRELSVARAMAVLHFLVEDSNIADGQCVVTGWGQYRPVASNDSSANKAKNRRVEIVVHAK